MRPPGPAATIGEVVPDRPSTHGPYCDIPKGRMGKRMPSPDRAFALRFRGTGTREGPDGGLLMLTALVERGLGGFGKQHPNEGNRPVPFIPGHPSLIGIVLELAITGSRTFQGAGEIGFGAAHAMILTTLGAGYLEPALDGSLSGVAAWRNDAGTGGYPVETGMVASLISIGAATAGRFEHETWLLFPGSFAELVARDV
jgi:hypothetical protein